jgi:hypothetical protein
MKRFLFLLVCFILVVQTGYAQSPKKMSYQCVIRNAANGLVASSPVGIRISILQGSSTGSSVYTETHTVSTNVNGLATIEIGGGTLVSGNFGLINWANGPYFIQSETDPNGGTTYSISAATQLLSVPYALYAETSGTPGPQGPTGLPGASGANGISVTSSSVIGDSLYITLSSGQILNAGHVTGATGPQGAQGPIGLTGATGPQGPTGLAGGTGPQGPIGLTGASGTQGAAGANGTNGTNGIDGKNNLAKTTIESAGANCATGGMKIEYGLDSNNNGVLDAGEVNVSLTKYICNGTSGAQGPIGLTGPTGASGPAGPQGLTGATGPQGSAGVNGINGTNGIDGQNNLAKTTIESAGANCATGGMKVEYGLDVNNNSVLDVPEINASLTKYICNGASGAQGQIGLTGATGPQGPIGITGATGAQGPIGLTGAQGPIGLTGANGVSVTSSSVFVDSLYITLSSGQILNAGHVTGATGPQGAQGPIGLTGTTGSQGPIGLTGASGLQGAIGQQGPTGATGPTGPIGLTGAQGPIGLTGLQGPVGNNGANGIDGKNTLAITTIESAGSNCATGGMKIEYGLDSNKNGLLDAIEINASLTKYVCNGATGAIGPQGPQGPIGLTGPMGAAGPVGPTGLSGATGPQGPIGLAGETGATGPQGPAGANGTNGTNGIDGKNTLANTTLEPAGANCATGGVKLEYGLDANNNGILDVSEINASLSKYICNGATGPLGPAGTNGNNGVDTFYVGNNNFGSVGNTNQGGNFSKIATVDSINSFQQKKKIRVSLHIDGIGWHPQNANSGQCILAIRDSLGNNITAKYSIDGNVSVNQSVQMDMYNVSRNVVIEFIADSGQFYKIYANVWGFNWAYGWNGISLGSPIWEYVY